MLLSSTAVSLGLCCSLKVLPSRLVIHLPTRDTDSSWAVRNVSLAMFVLDTVLLHSLLPELSGAEYFGMLLWIWIFRFEIDGLLHSAHCENLQVTEVWISRNGLSFLRYKIHQFVFSPPRKLWNSE